MKKVLSALAVFISISSAFCADYGIDRREVGEAFLGRRFPQKAADIKPDSSNLPQMLSQTGAFEKTGAGDKFFDPTKELVPARAMIPYAVNTPLWSDSAVKKRWIYVPKDAQIGFSQDGPWSFPAGTVMVKHFDLITDYTKNPNTKRQLETRFVIVDSTGKDIYAITYRWIGPGYTDAKLVVAAAGEKETIAIAGGNPASLEWLYPSRTACLACHHESIGGTGTKRILGVKTAQLNGEFLYPSGKSDNQLRTMNHVGLFSGAPASLDNAVVRNGILSIQDTSIPQMAPFGEGKNNTGFSLDARVRSYLDANCAHCHNPDKTGRFDARWTETGGATPLADIIGSGHLKFCATVDKLPSQGGEIYDRDSRNMPSTSLRPKPPIADPLWVGSAAYPGGLLGEYLTKNFIMKLVKPSTPPALNKVVIVFNAPPGNSATVAGNYSFVRVSDKNAAITLQGNGTINGSEVAFTLSGNMDSKKEYQVTITGDVSDPGGNKAPKNRPVQFQAPTLGPQLNVDDGSAPSNDDFSSATLLTGLNATDTGFNCYASKEVGEPDHADNPGGKSVWWDWIAPTNGLVEIDTFGSDFDTVLGVYTGSPVSGLILATTNSSDNDAPDANLPPTSGPTTSFVSFYATQGQTYHIAVDGQNDGYFTLCGNISLHVHVVAPAAQGPLNDSFATPFVLNGSSGSVVSSNILATKEFGEPDHAEDLGGSSVWWQWTAPSDGLATFDTHGSAFDTLLGVYIGSSVDNLTLVVDNDDDSELLTSGVQFNAAAGATYYIAVDGYEGETGSITLNYSNAPAPMILAPVLVTIPSFMVLPTDNGSIHLQISGPAGAVFEVQVSDDLLNWTSAETRTLSGTPWIFSDPISVGRQQCFYRVVRHLPKS